MRDLYKYNACYDGYNKCYERAANAMKMRISRDQIVEAGLSLVREEGEGKLSVRNVAARLGCSTQPIMYCYPTMAEFRADILEKANSFHISRLVNKSDDNTDLLIMIGINYIKFAWEEKNLFKFIAMSDKEQNAGLAELISTDDPGGILTPLRQMYGLTADEAKNVFEALFACFHGYAALMAYSCSAKYDALHYKKELTRVYRGLIAEVKRETPERPRSEEPYPVTL